MSSITDEMRQVIKQFQYSENDVGSAPIQITLLTFRVNELTEHLKKFNKDNHSRRGLLKMVARRRKLMTYLKRTKPETYQKLLNVLNLRG